MSGDDVTPAERKRRVQQRASLYRRLAGFKDRDALHEALTRNPSLLDRDVPTVIAAARFRGLDEHRKEARRARIVTESAAELLPSQLSLDPLQAVLAREELAQLRAALAELDQIDLLVVWLHASGHSDQEIADTWDALKLKPAAPSPAAIRKRRARVREQLRTQLGKPEH